MYTRLSENAAYPFKTPVLNTIITKGVLDARIVYSNGSRTPLPGAYTQWMITGSHYNAYLSSIREQPTSSNYTFTVVGLDANTGLAFKTELLFAIPKNVGVVRVTASDTGIRGDLIVDTEKIAGGNQSFGPFDFSLEPGCVLWLADGVRSVSAAGNVFQYGAIRFSEGNGIKLSYSGNRLDISAAMEPDSITATFPDAVTAINGVGASASGELKVKTIGGAYIEASEGKLVFGYKK